MESYLKNVRQSLPTIEHKKIIHIVMGNESCDLDSCISSIVYAYLLNIIKCHSDDCLVLPIMNTKRSLFKLKTEVIYWVHEVLKMDPNLLICKDDLDLHRLQGKERQVLITLVDHNANEELERIGNLAEIIDHHQETQVSRRSSDLKVEIDTGVGSCCTLVARRYINYCGENEVKVDEQISLLLYGPIILDTICFSNDARRFNELDLQIAKKLELILNEHSLTRDHIYSQLIDAKNSISTLTFREILYKDMKLVHPFDDFKVITSSISGQLVQNLISNKRYDQILNDLNEISKEQNYSLILMMGITTKLNSIERDIAIYSPNDNLLKKVTQTLFNHNNKELDLCIVDSKSNLIVLSQKNVQASRKVILPVIEELFRSEQFIEDWNAGVFSTNRAASDTDRLQSNDPLKSIPESRTTNGRSNEGKLNGQEVRSGSVESTSSTTGKLMDARVPDSMNYYAGSDFGSYFMDSFVGELVGDVANDKLNDQQIDQLNWCDDQRIENALEFGFDSFGPESILFQTTNGDFSIMNNVKKLETIRESSEKANDGNHDSNENKFNRSDDEDEETNDCKSETSMPELRYPSITNDNDDYENLVSLSVAEPQLKQKLDTCFDANKIRNGYDITAEPKSILAFDRSLSGGVNRYNELDDYYKEEFNRELDRQFNNELHRQSSGKLCDQHLSDKITNKLTDSQREEFDLNDDSLKNDLEDENFNSLIERNQLQNLMDSHRNVVSPGQVEQNDVSNEYKTNDESNLIDNDGNLSSDQLPGNDTTLENVSDRANSTSTISNTSHTISNLSTDDRTLVDENQFKRQSTLTKSQRRRITPKYKFEEMPSTDTELILNRGTDDLLEQIAKQQQEQDELKSDTLNDNHLSTISGCPEAATNSQPDNLKSGYASRAGTLPKKKIVADFKEDSHEESVNNHLDNPLLSNDHYYSTINTPEHDRSNDLRPTSIKFSNPPSKSKTNYPETKNIPDEMKKMGLNDGLNLNEQEYANVPNWQESCPIGRVGEIKKIDMKVIEPYTRVISHAGYYTNGSENQAIGDSNPPAIILFSSCYLPDRTRKDYDYVMDNLFMYVLTTLHQLIANEYIMIYFHNAGCGANTSANNMPTFAFLRRCYFLIDRKLRKSLKALYLVHPTLWLKSIVIMSKPFINTKFSKKLKFVNNLSELNHLVPVDLKIIPDLVKQTDEVIERKKRKR